MTGPLSLYPPTDLVVPAWLRGVPGLLAGVGPSLPSSAESWAAEGFVQAYAVGGTPPVHSPMRRPVVSVDCWAVNLNSQKSPWGKANALAEFIRVACERNLGFGALLVLGGDYMNARVLTAYPAGEPRRVYGDASNYARYQFDLNVAWVVAT